jgi:hypothetical protein
LIKINAKIVDTLLEVASAQDCEVSTKENILKLLISRQNLVDGVNKEDLMSKVGAAL